MMHKDRRERHFPSIRTRTVVGRPARLLQCAGLAAALSMLSGCAALIEKSHVQAVDNSVFTPFVRASLILSRGDAKTAGTEQRPVHSLPQGNAALDFDMARIEGKDEDSARQRTFTINTYALSLRGSTRPERFGGLYLEGLVGAHRVDMTSASPIGMTVTADEFGWLLGWGLGYAITDNATIHVRSSGGSAATGAIATQEVLATYWFTPNIGLSGGYRTGDYFNEFVLAGFSFKWRGPTAGLVAAF